MLLRTRQISRRRVCPVRRSARDLHLGKELESSLHHIYLWYTNMVRNDPLPCPRFFPLQTMEEKLPVNYGALQPPFSSSQQSLAVFQFPLCQSLPESLHLWCLLKISYPAYRKDQAMRKHTKYFWNTLNGVLLGIASVIYNPPCYNLFLNYILCNLLSNKPRWPFSCLLFITV